MVKNSECRYSGSRAVCWVTKAPLLLFHILEFIEFIEFVNCFYPGLPPISI